MRVLLLLLIMLSITKITLIVNGLIIDIDDMKKVETDCEYTIISNCP